MKLAKHINFRYLLILIAGMLAFKFGLLETQPGYFSVLGSWHYLVLVLACTFVAAGGLFVNQTMAVGRVTDLPEDKAFNVYLALTGMGLLLGFYIAYSIGKPFYTGAFVVGAAVFYIYATSLKQVAIINNIIVALLAVLPFFIIIMFDLSPSASLSSMYMARTLLNLIMDYCYYLFIIALIVSFLNDLAHADRDYNEGLNTLPIIAGRARAARIIFFLSLLMPIGLFVYTDLYLTELLYAVGYLLLFVLGPLIYFIIKLWNAATEKDFKHLEKVLTWVVLPMLLSIAVITFNIKHNVAG